MQDEEERVKRKRERSRSRTDEERGSRGKKHQKKEQIVVPSPPQIQLEISSDDEIEKKEQSALVHNFLARTSASFQNHELWRGASAEELDNASEGLEKYLLSKMYRVLFRPKLSDDGVRDEILRDRMALLSFLEPQHLDIPAGSYRPDQLRLAMQELVKMDTYKAPRDKMICILNASKLIFNMLQHAKTQGNADTFLPILIFVTLKANPPHLHSNLQYIQRFRNPAKLMGETGYFLTHMMGAVAFIEKVDASQLSIDPHAFEDGLARTIESHAQRTSAALPPAPAPAQALPPASSSPSSSSATPLYPLSLGAPAAPRPAASHAASGFDALGLSSSSSAAPTTHAPAQSFAAALGPVPLLPAPFAAPASSSFSPHASFPPRANGVPDLLSGGAAPSSLPPAGHSSSMNSEAAFDLSSLDPLNVHIPSSHAATAQPPAQPPAGHHLELYLGMEHSAATTATSSSASSCSPSRPPSHMSHTLPGAPAHTDPFRNASVAQLIAASQEPPVEKFLHCTIEELGMADIPLLLADYKRLAALNDNLVRTLKLNVAM